MSEEQLDRRAMLEAAMEAAEEGTLEAPEEKEIVEPEADPIIEENKAEEQVEIQESDDSSERPAEMVAESESEGENEEPQDEEVKPVSRPSTWKKEYVQIWDKMEKGEQISKEDFVKFAEYANQRESEYKKGVSTYKAEADRARAYEEAIAPFVPELQAQGITPAAWINNLGRAHMILTKAPYDQKVQMFQRLASDYGIQFNGESVAPIQQDAYTQQLMSQLNQVNQEVSTIKNRFQQEENQRLMNEIEKYRSDVEKYPHFDVVREEMAQLLELGKAQDLETAYKKAVRMNDDVWSLEQERLLNDAKQKAIKAQQVAKAKAAAVSPKSVTPSGKVIEPGDKKDRKSLIAAQLAEMTNRL
jgi:hypothetical protein